MLLLSKIHNKKLMEWIKCGHLYILARTVTFIMLSVSLIPLSYFEILSS